MSNKIFGKRHVENNNYVTRPASNVERCSVETGKSEVHITMKCVVMADLFYFAPQQRAGSTTMGRSVSVYTLIGDVVFV